MDQYFQKAPQLDYPFGDVGDAKYVSGLSTILVATIQEAKDRISQIEYIFCSQLFPNFQSKSKSLQKFFSDAREAAEDTCKNKESDLLLRIEKLQLENKVILEENQSLKLEKAQFVSNRVSLVEPIETNSSVVDGEKKMKELEEKNNMLVQKQRTLELKVQEIRRELVKKSKEVDEGMEMENRLHQLVQSKESLILEKEKQLKEKEEKKNELVLQIEFLEKSFRMIQDQFYRKSNEAMKEQELHEKLLNEKKSYLLESDNNKQLLVESQKEKQLLTSKVERLEGKVNELQNEMKKKNEEVEEGRKLQEKYLEQIDKNTKELLKAAQQLEKLENENILHVAKRKGLEDKLDKFEAILRDRANEASEGFELHSKLLQQIEEKDSELQSEKKKKRDVIAVYKNLKSQYNFLLAKFGLTTESLNRPNELKDESNSSRHVPHDQNPLASPDNFMRAPIERSRGDSPSSSNSLAASMEPLNTRSGSLAGTKRPVSSWRDTRLHQRQGGLDPHDNFLDTPLENIIRNIKKSSKDEEVNDIPDPAPRDINLDSSDDETQELAGDVASKKPAPGPGVKNGFKYIESVRKRAERENLKGIECKQCRKFYDAVLPEGGDRDSLRCEHHDGVSRHRYRFAPPSTPEGFWNIGFESEM